MKVHQQSAEVVAMSRDWSMIDALMGGTRTMRDAGASLMPIWPGEEPDAYEARRNTATLYPAFRRTVGVMIGKPFSKEVTPGDDIPPQVAALLPNIDGQGSNLHSFAVEVAKEALAYGIAGVLVDFTKIDRNQVRTRAQEVAAGARPYWVWVRHGNILGWRSEAVNGIQKLTQLRLAETATVDDGEFGTREAIRVRVLSIGKWDLYEKRDRRPDNNRLDLDEYERIDGGDMPLDVIPFVPFYGEKRGFMTGGTPLMDLAFLNVKHWQSQSDQDTLLHVARVPLLAVVGAQLSEHKPLIVAAGKTINLPDKDADIKYVEHSGQALGAGQTSLEALEQQMIQTGAELLVAKPGDRTATEANNDAEGNKSDLQRIVESLENSLDECLQMTALWLKLPDGGHCSVFKDFGAMNLSDASATIVQGLQASGVISKETLLREMQRRGLLSPDLKLDEELEAAEADGPPIAMLAIQAKAAQAANDPDDDEPPPARKQAVAA